jgi:hypothetical protein
LILSGELIVFTTTSKIRAAFSLRGLLWLAAVAALGQASASAQDHYYPLNQQSPTGMYGEWSGWQQRHRPCGLQPVQVELPGGGTVNFYSSINEAPLSGASPAMAAVALGYTYRLKLSDMPEFPGVELYPTIELVDVLHPPEGRADEYPIPVVFTAEEIASAIEGRLVTKVVYLEPAQEANPFTLSQPYPQQTVDSRANVIEEADHRGRPLIVVRLGSRIPTAQEPEFFGAGAPLAPRTKIE